MGVAKKINKLDAHPSVQRWLPRPAIDGASSLSAEDMKALCLESGADDVGLVSIRRSEIDEQREDILRAAPWTKSLLSFCCRMNREPIRTPERSVANLEFHHTGEQVDQVARKVVAALERRGIRAINPSMGFPMEMDRFPGKIWVVSHKPVAVAAGLGQIGIHRNVIHPKFGNFILLGTILVDRDLSADGRDDGTVTEFNPCLECKLCVAACPVGAIGPDGHFNFSACYTHNYREFMGGFTDWVEDVAESKSAKDYRTKVSDSESASVWQSLSFGANYKAAYCLSVCPAGEDVISPFLENRSQFINETLKPLQKKEETVYVMPGTDAETHVLKRFPHKHVKQVGSVLRSTSIVGFVQSMHLVFQREKSAGLGAVYHFEFTGLEQVKCTVTIRDKTLEVRDDHVGDRDLLVRADARTWLSFLRGEKSIVWAILTRKIRLRGDPRLLLQFGKCFP